MRYRTTALLTSVLAGGLLLTTTTMASASVAPITSRPAATYILADDNDDTDGDLPGLVLVLISDIVLDVIE